MILTKDDFEIGQEVACRYAGNMIRRNGNGYKVGKVSKVGRKLITVSLGGGKGIQFELEDKIERDYLLQKSNYSGEYELFPSVQAYCDFEEKKEKAYKISTAITAYGDCDLSINQIRRIYDIITE